MDDKKRTNPQRRPEDQARQPTAAGVGRGRVGLSNVVTPGGRSRNQTSRELQRPSGSRDQSLPEKTNGPASGSKTSRRGLLQDGSVPDLSPAKDNLSLLQRAHRQKQRLLHQSHVQGSSERLARHEATHDPPGRGWDSSPASADLMSLASTSQPMMNKTSLALLKREPKHHFYRTPSSTSYTTTQTMSRTHDIISDADVTNGETSMMMSRYESENEVIPKSRVNSARPEVNSPQDLPKSPAALEPDEYSLVSAREPFGHAAEAQSATSGVNSAGTKGDSEQELKLLDDDPDLSPELPHISFKSSAKEKRILSWRSVAQSLTGQVNLGGRRDMWGMERRGRAPGFSQSVQPAAGSPQMTSAPKLMRQKTDRKNLNWCQFWIQKAKSWWKRNRQKHKENPVFRNKIRKVEGRFGSGMAAFLLFIRHLLLLDTVLAAMWLLLVIVPQAVHTDYVPIKADFYIRNLLDGGDGLARSWWFYGSYEQKVGASYPEGLMYLVATLLTYFGGLFVVFRSTAQALEEEGGAAVKDARYMFSRYVFSSWDYALTSREGVHSLSLGIASLFRDQMSEIQTQQEEKTFTRRQWTRLVARRVGVWLLTLILIALGCTAIVFATSSRFLAEVLVKLGYNAAESEQNVVVVFGPTVIFMVVNAVIPMCIYKLPKLENYAHPKTELHVSIGRVFVLHMANLMSLVVSTYSNVSEATSKRLCPGTLIGQELYKLVVLDTVVGVLTELLPALAYYYWTKKKKEFDMASSVLTVIERQALIWLGTLVCPVMPLVGVVTMTSIFLTYYFVITVTCCPPRRRWNQSRRNSFLMGLTVTTLLLLLGPVSVAITRVDIINLGQMADGGAACGPFGNQSMTHLVVEYTTKDDWWLSDVLRACLSSTILLPAILLMMAVIYYQSMRVHWEKRKRKMLAAELINEREESKEMTKRLHGLSTY